MTTPFDRSTALVPLTRPEAAGTLALPNIIRRAGQAALFAAKEFFYGAIRNEHTRNAYRRAVDRFLAWCESGGLDLPRISASDVGHYFDPSSRVPVEDRCDELRNERLSIATGKQHLAAIRHFFDGMVTRHAIILNPALSVRGDHYEAVEGKALEISVPQARQLLASIDTSNAAGLRDRAILVILAYTSSRAGAAAKLRCGDFYDVGDQWMLRFEEKGGKHGEIPVRDDLQQYIAAYFAAGLQNARKDAPMFRAAIGRTGKLASAPIQVNDVCRMMERRLKEASLPSPPLAALVPRRRHHRPARAWRAARRRAARRRAAPGRHADPRTTRLYDRRQKKVTRNIVKRISI
jgi:integrase/recombinase XerD